MTQLLPEVQRAFAAGVFDDSDALLPQLRDGIFPAARHLQIYRNNTFTNLTDALGMGYPAIRKLVGEDFFDELANAYIRRHPPRSGNLHDFGSALAEFLTDFAPAQSLPYLADVARLEWAWQESYHAAEAEPLAPQALAAVRPEEYAGIIFRPHPSVRLFCSRFPCLRIWQMNQPDADDAATVNLDAGGEQLLIIRRDLDVTIISLDPGTHALLHAISHGRTLSDATDAALAVDSSFDLAATLRHHVAAKTFVGFDIGPTSNPILEIRK